MAVCPWQLLLTLSSWSISYSWQHARLSSLYLLLLKLWCNYFGETMDVLCYSGSQSLAYDLFTTKLQSCATGCMSRAGKRSTKKAEKKQSINRLVDWLKINGQLFWWLINHFNYFPSKNAQHSLVPVYHFKSNIFFLRKTKKLKSLGSEKLV